MRRALLGISLGLLLSNVFVYGVDTGLSHGLGDTNEVVIVNQDGKVNASGIASVEDIAEAAAKAEIAAAKSEIAAQTAVDVTNAVQVIVDNIMSNRVVIYRQGYADSFAALTIISDSDTCAIVNATWIQQGADAVVVDVDYVCSADVSGTKPNVYAHNTLDGGVRKIDFELCNEAWVTDPVYHVEARSYHDVSYAGYYTVRVTIPNPDPQAKYFLFIKLSGNDPGGTGAQLRLDGGVVGGITANLQFGDKVVNVKGGLVKGYTNAE